MITFQITRKARLGLTFSHPQNGNVLADISGHYEWSPNLIDWYGAGEGPAGGAKVNFAVLTAEGTSTVTATSSTPLPHIFVRAGVTRN